MTTPTTDIAINEPIVERYRATIVGSSKKEHVGEWRSSYAEATGDLGVLLLEAGTGRAAEIEKVFMTQRTITALEEQAETAAAKAASDVVF